MPIKYNIHQDPPRKDAQPSARHLRTVDLKTVDADQFADAMHRHTPLYSKGTCLGLLLDMADTLPEVLASGCAVHIDGLGTFAPRVEGDVTGTGGNLRAKNVKVGSVEFRPDEELLRAVNRHARFEHVLETRRSQPTDEEVDSFLADYFATHVTLRRHQLESHFLISKRSLKKRCEGWQFRNNVYLCGRKTEKQCSLLNFFSVSLRQHCWAD